MKAVTLRAPVAILAGLLVAGAALGQQRAAPDYPNKPIRGIVPFVPGGPNDVIGRLVGQKLMAAWGHNLIIDNRGGAGGIIGTEMVAKSAPDGYTVLISTSAHALLPAFNKLPYDPVRDFAAITTSSRVPGYLLGVHPSMPVRSVKELIALAKKNPGKLNYGSSGIGGVLHVATEMFNSAAGIKMTVVHYKGIGQLITDLVGGHIDLSFLTLSTAVGMVKSGQVKAIAISGKNRWKHLPDVPTVDEAGVKGFEYYAWFGFWFPAGTPTEIVSKFHDEVAKAVAAPDLVQRFDELGFVPFIQKPDEFTNLVQKDIDAAKKLATQLGITAQ
ncbi:MAG: tripartite tricarboxylate transporter substrate binding protein [Sulfuricaulis sp.]|nr:tripartite tricarboxylate transporter substrate binding protein [Sulfuricaulis sp.]